MTQMNNKTTRHCALAACADAISIATATEPTEPAEPTEPIEPIEPTEQWQYQTLIPLLGPLKSPQRPAQKKHCGFRLRQR